MLSLQEKQDIKKFRYELLIIKTMNAYESIKFLNTNKIQLCTAD